MGALVPVLASLSVLACGNDGSTSDLGAAAETVGAPTTTPSTAVDASIDAPTDATSAPTDAASLLIDSLPELTGPTVLWFWAPG